MRRKDESKKPIIVNYINGFFYEHDKVPTVRESEEQKVYPSFLQSGYREIS